MKIIRHGITRTVILTKNYAIKLPSLRAYGDGLAGVLWSICRGILANQSEAQWWRNSMQRQFLCPVLHSWLGGIINIYPRCQPYTVEDDRQMKRPIPELMPQPGDDKSENYGLLYGRLVILDYDMNYNGCPHDRSGAVNRLELEENSRG